MAMPIILNASFITMNNSKLKIGVLLNSYTVPKWQYQIIDTIINSNFAEISLILKFTPMAVNKLHMQGSKSTEKNPVFSFHLLLDELLFSKNTDFANSSDLTNTLAGIDVFQLTSPVDKNNVQPDSVAVAQISTYKLDVILQLIDKQLTGEILAVPRYGIWAYHHSSGQITKGGPSGYWEVINREDIIFSDLLLINPSFPGGRVIYRSSLLPDHLSLTKNQNASYWRASLAMPRVLEGVHRYGESYLRKSISRFEADLDNKGCSVPNSLEASKNAFLHFSYLVSRLWRKAFYVDHWSILYKTKADDPLNVSLDNYKTLTQPPDRLWADPFVISFPDKHYIFVEELPYNIKKGHISVIETNKRGEVLRCEKVLEKEYHLSYPFLLNINNVYYMIPETGANRTIELYRSTDFPYKWEFVMNLMENVLAADVTLFFHEEKWWLFCCIDDTGRNIGMMDELHLFYADDLFTKEWNRHPGNPIGTDVRTARPAGNIFKKDNKIYRPSQDCSGMYGKAININHITTLTETNYQETVVARILPDKKKGIIGTHTINFSDGMTVIDRFKYRRRIIFNG